MESEKDAKILHADSKLNIWLEPMSRVVPVDMRHQRPLDLSGQCPNDIEIANERFRKAWLSNAKGENAVLRTDLPPLMDSRETTSQRSLQYK